MRTSEPPRLIIFDVDGTLRWTTVPGQQCPYNAGEWKLMPNVREKLTNMRWGPGGTMLGVASNQNAVAAGFLSRETALELIEDTLVEAIGFLPPGTQVELCTCPVYVNCKCRKPEPEMLLRIIRKLAIPNERTLFVGDLNIDKEAALRAGVRFAHSHEFFASSEVFW
jgi:HAD superfamily hydrolase (TIGR01662 family)